MASYRELLRNPRWQRMRLQIMERDNWACRFCADADSPLNVHHDYYQWGNHPWEYPEDSLYTLCEACHTLCDNSDCPKVELKELLISRYCWGTMNMEGVTYLFARHGLGPL